MRGAATARGAAGPQRPAAVDAALLAEVVAGLRRPTKRLPTRLLYDEVGSALYEEITTLDAYYPTRTEISILRRHLPDIARMIGPRARVVEFGSGSGIKTRMLLEALVEPVAYTPVDIAAAQLADFSRELAEEFPALEVLPVHADFTRPVPLPVPAADVQRTLAFFPGSTIGNLEPGDAVAFLRNIARVVGEGGQLLIGVDLRKDRRRLEHAYNDPEGVTAAFDLNILAHVNRLCDADFDPSAFRHHAPFNEAESRIEMHLVATRDQVVRLGRSGPNPVEIAIARGEPIVTEFSYKYDVEGFGELAAEAGFRVERVWLDRERLFSVQLLQARPRERVIPPAS